MKKNIELPIVLPKNHFTLTSSYYIQQACNAYLAALNITVFGHTRIYNDGSRFVLCNRPDWAEHCFNKGYVYLTRLNRDPISYQSGIYLWDAWDPTHPGHQIVGNDAADNFNIGRGITLLEKSKDWIDKYEFASTPNNYVINNFYINHIELLKNFISFYRNNTKYMLIDAIKSKAVVPYHGNTDMYVDYPDTFIPSVSDDQLKSAELSVKNLNSSYTKRELECVYWLIQGKTVPEIGMILNLSSRTVEKFIASIKNKLGCYTLFQLGQKIANLGLDTLILHTHLDE